MSILPHNAGVVHLKKWEEGPVDDPMITVGDSKTILQKLKTHCGETHATNKLLVFTVAVLAVAVQVSC